MEAIIVEDKETGISVTSVSNGTQNANNFTGLVWPPLDAQLNVGARLGRASDGTSLYLV